MNFPRRIEAPAHKIDPCAPDPNIAILIDLYMQEPLHVLDLGCGNGNNAIDMVRKGHTVLGIEPNESYRTECERKAQLLDANTADRVSFRDGDLATPFILGKDFNAVVLTKVLHELASKSDAMSALNGIRKITRPGGLNIVSAYVEKPKELEELETVPGLILFKPGELADIYEDHGWGVLYTRDVSKRAKKRTGGPMSQPFEEIVAQKPKPKEPIALIVRSRPTFKGSNIRLAFPKALDSIQIAKVV